MEIKDRKNLMEVNTGRVKYITINQKTSTKTERKICKGQGARISKPYWNKKKMGDKEEKKIT